MMIKIKQLPGHVVVMLYLSVYQNIKQSVLIIGRFVFKSSSVANTALWERWAK
jgi:hypothetical protein